MHNATARLIEAAGEVKLCALDLTEIERSGLFEGYATVFNRQDIGRDVVMPGAFRRSLVERGISGIRMLFQHDPAQPIGTWLSIYEDARGLKVRGRLAIEVCRAREVLALLKAQAIDGLSIGFRAIDSRRDRATGIRRLTRIDLWEISIVTFPMLPEARITAVKSIRTHTSLGEPSTHRVNSEIDEAAKLIRATSAPSRFVPSTNP